MVIRNRSVKQIREGWYSFLRVLSRNSKLKFVIGHPSTNGKEISLPPLPAELTQDDLDVFESNALHEVGHCQHSDIPFFQAFSKEYGGTAQFVLNALDDVFMMRKSARFNKMAERRFRRAAAILVERKQFRDGSASAAEALACYCMTYLFSRNWSEYRPAHTTIEGNFDIHFGEHAETLKSNLNEILDREFPSVLSTPDAGALTLSIFAMLEAQSQFEEEDQNHKDEDESREDDEQDQRESDDSANGEPDQSDDKNGQGKSGQPGQDDADDAESKEGEGSNGSGNNEANDSNSGDAETDKGNSKAGGESDDASTEDGNSEAGSESGDANTGNGNGDDGCDDQTPSKGSGKTLKEIVSEMLDTDPGDEEVFDMKKAVQMLSDEIANGQSDDYSPSELVTNFEISGEVENSSDDKTPSVNSPGGVASTKVFVDGMPVCDSDRAAAQALRQRVDRKANVLATKLQSLLLNREEADVYASRRGQLSTKSLYRLSLDDTRVFEKTEEILLPTAAVSVCADLSGSTEFVSVPKLKCKCCEKTGNVLVGILDLAFCTSCGGSFKVDSDIEKDVPAAVAIQQALLLLESVLERLGTPREFIGFAPKTGGTLNTMIRTFGDAHNTAVNRIGGLSSQVGGDSTPIGEAVMQASMRLQAHGSQKKVLFVLTDGDPSSVEKAVQMTDLAQRGGVIVVYLLIGTNVRCDWLKNAKIPFAHAKTADDLCPILLDQVGSLLK
jgi:hypothetical protein